MLHEATVTTARRGPGLRPEQGAQLREFLLAAGYTEQNAAHALSLPMPLRIPDGHVSWLSRRLTEAGVLTDVIRLFLLGQPVQRTRFESLVSPAAGARLADSGLLSLDGERLRAEVRITPVGNLLLAHDAEDPVLPDHVPGIGPATRTLAGLTVRERVAVALDLGTGCGIQALLAASHADRVVATDISERALQFARFNAALNGIENVEFRQGNLFEPVAGDTFDLITANPPFVVSPDNAYTFRDSGLRRDAVSEAVVEGSAALLREGGHATVLCSWIHNHDDPEGPVQGWLGGAGCDAWVLHHESEEPRDYAVKWNELARRDGSVAFEAAVDRWLEYFEAERITQIASGAVILRRRAGENWFRMDSMPAAPRGAASSHILRFFDAQQRLLELDDDERLLDTVFALIDGHHLDQSMAYQAREYRVDGIHMHLDEGVGLQGSIEPLAIHVLLRMDGIQSLRALLSAVEDELGLGGVELRETVLTAVRELFGLGLIEAVSE